MQEERTPKSMEGAADKRIVKEVREAIKEARTTDAEAGRVIKESAQRGNK